MTALGLLIIGAGLILGLAAYRNESPIDLVRSGLGVVPR